jgi:Aspartyl protease
MYSRPLIAFLLALLLSSVSSAGSPDGEAVETGFILQDNLVRLPAQIDGQPATVVLDSAASALLLDKAFAGRLGVLQENAVGTGLGGGRGPQPFFPAKIKSIRVGPFNASEPTAFAMDLSPFSKSAGFQIDALIGQPVLADRYVKIDYPTRRVTFGPVGQAAKCAAPIPLTIVNGAPVAEVQLQLAEGAEPVTLRMVVDLGTRHSLALIGGPFLKTAAGKKLLEAGKSQKIGTGAGGEVQGVFIQAESLKLGSRLLKRPQVGLTDQVKAFEVGFVDGSLGVPLWKRGAITFDFSHQTLCLDLPR